MPRWWAVAATLAAGLFAAGVPLSIFVAQIGIFSALLLVLLRPRSALRPLAERPWLVAALALYFLVQTAAVLFSQHPLRSFICLRGDWPVLFLPLLLALFQVRSARRTAWIAVLAAAAAGGLLGFFQHLTGVDPLQRIVLESDGAGRFHGVGSLSGHLTYGGVMMVAFVGALAQAMARAGRERALLLGAAAACGLGLVASYARSALLGGLAGAAVALAAAPLLGGPDARRRWRRALLPAVVLLLVCVALIAATPGLRDRILALGWSGDSPRLRLWGTALAIFRDFPLFGAGLGAYKSHFALYRLPGDYMAIGHPHSDPLNVLVHSGLAGLLAWIALWTAALAAALRRGECERSPAAGTVALAVTAAFLVGGLAQCYFTDEEPAGALWLFLALAISETTGTPAPRPAGRTGRSCEQPIKRGLLHLARLLFLPRAHRAAPDRRAAPRGPLGGRVRILLVRQDNRLGNLVLITPFLQALRRAAPDAQITLLAGSRFEAVLAGAPWFDELMLMHKRRLIRQPWTYAGHLGELRRGGFAVAFDLSNPDTHSFYSAFAPLVARAAWRVGFDHPRSRPALNVPVAGPERECHASLAPLLLLSALGAPVEPLPLRLSPTLIGRARARGERAAAVVIHPGGRGAKQWSPDGFRAVTGELAAQAPGPVRLIGGPAEHALLTDLAGGLGDVEICPIETLEDLVAALTGAGLYLGCDAGPLHVAAALEVPTLSLFLTSHPLRYAPLGPRHLALLLGDRSRAWAREERCQPPATVAAPPLWRAQADVALALTRQRPRCVDVPAATLSAQAEAVVHHALSALARPTGEPTGGTP